MERYIAFLRGVNVGGNNKISMPVLKETFEENGFLNVRTYINSGNIIFSSDIQNKSKLTKQCETIIVDKFNTYISVLVLSPNELSDILSNAPDWWDSGDQERYNSIIFVIPPTTADEVYAVIGEAKPDYEQVEIYKNVIFWSFKRNYRSKTQWGKTGNTSFKNKITVRNANTARKLLKLAEKSE
ncbi:hypothetical protein LFYK43_21040 [Ligilactobacillus salitolerans]|uniref:DUF1697 domain-containing protein n=1 Tax=Ligilactobacillus salitolerans TaxID=1808352 RepID=A0A401IVW2_9LACO|nr:DUF1697 domain-containing protein [Ligilactobacillus salitolerans]GBG95645.1 hypothetical protein LFYK43_21040 [Ligilactobacillus salitolerans]